VQEPSITEIPNPKFRRRTRSEECSARGNDQLLDIPMHQTQAAVACESFSRQRIAVAINARFARRFLRVENDGDEKKDKRQDTPGVHLDLHFGWGSFLSPTIDDERLAVLSPLVHH
jgi:hypothetical protein